MEAPPGDAQTAEYDALWTAVRQNGATFEQWETLAKFSLTLGDVDKTREVFDSFLARYPLCYAYWRQYANAVAAADGDAEAILERGVAATPYSTDLWIEYVDRVSKREGEDTVDATRTLLTRAAQYVSIDWLAHKLIDRWVAFEEEHGTVRSVAQVYTTALTLPMKDSARLHTAFTEYVSGKPLAELLDESEVAAHTQEAKRAKAAQAANGSSDAPPQGTEANAAASVDAQQPAADKPPGADAGTASAAAGNAAEGTKNTGEDLEVSPEEIKAAWLEAHNRVFEATLAVRERRWQYEAHIKRRWWNYKPLEAEQLLTWWLLIDEVEAEGNATATYGLFERCLVPCASYPEFWCRYLCFLRGATTLPDVATIIAFAASRASQVFCAARPDCLLCCALLYELQGDADAARAMHSAVREHVAPRLLEGASRAANFERRAGNGERALEILRAAFGEHVALGDAQSALWLSQDIAAMQAQAAAADIAPNGTAATPQQAATDEIETLLEKHPQDASVWAAAVSSAEQRYSGPARAQAVLALCRRALSAPAAAVSADAAAAAAQQPLALPLEAREAQVASAMAAMDLYGTTEQMWETLALSVWLQREVLQGAVMSRKRAATGGYEQPDAKRQMTGEYAAPQAAAAGAYYQQQGGEYAAYYQQQGYYGGFAAQ